MFGAVHFVEQILLLKEGSTGSVPCVSGNNYGTVICPKTKQASRQ